MVANKDHLSKNKNRIFAKTIFSTHPIVIYLIRNISNYN